MMEKHMCTYNNLATHNHGPYVYTFGLVYTCIAQCQTFSTEGIVHLWLLLQQVKQWSVYACKEDTFYSHWLFGMSLFICMKYDPS